MQSKRWTPQAKARQAALIRQWEPWKQSTGPRTAKGKATVSANAYKGGTRPMIRAMAGALREQRYSLQQTIQQ